MAQHPLSKPTPENAMSGNFGGFIYNKQVARNIIFNKNANLIIFFGNQLVEEIYVNNDMLTNVINSYVESNALDVLDGMSLTALEGHQITSIRTNGAFQIIYSV